MQQGRLIVGGEALVELSHKGRLVDKGEAPDGMDVGKVLLHDAAQVAAGGKTWRDEPGEKMLCEHET